MPRLKDFNEDPKSAVLRLLGPLEEKALDFVDDACLKRYLAARSNNPKKAAHLLKGTLKWRKDYGVDDFKPEAFGMELKRGGFYIAGQHENGRPILIMKPIKKLKPSEEEFHARYICFTIEECIKLMPESVQTWVWIMNLEEYSLTNAPSLSLVIKVIRILQSHYPERMFKCYFVDAPKVFSAIYKAVYKFVDPETRDNLVFINTEDYDEAGLRNDGKNDPTDFTSYIRFSRLPFDEDKAIAYWSNSSEDGSSEDCSASTTEAESVSTSSTKQFHHSCHSDK